MKKFLQYLKIHPRAAALVIAGAIWLAFAPALRYGFLEIDDPAYVVRNQHLAWSAKNFIWNATYSPVGLYTPLPGWSFMLDHAVAAMKPWGYHAFNIFYHMLAALALWGILRRFCRNHMTALFGVLFWALSPQRVESVAWVAERKDVLLGACVLGSIFFLLKGKKYFIPSLLLAAAAPFAKPSGMLAVVAVAGMLLLKRKEIIFRWHHLLYLVIPVALLMFRPEAGQAAAMTFGATEGFFFVAARVCCNYAEYFVKTFLPIGLNVLYPHFELAWPQLIAAFSMAAGSVAAAIFLVRKKWYPELTFALLWGIFLLPVAGAFIYGNMTFADRNSYVPSAFLICGAAVLFERLDARRRALLPIWGAGMLLAVWCVGTWRHIAAFENTTTYLQSACSGRKANYRAAAALGLRELKRDRRKEVVELIGKMRAPHGQMSATDRDLTELYIAYLEGLLYFREQRFAASAERLAHVLNAPRLAAVGDVADDAHWFLFDTASQLALMRGDLLGAAQLREALAMQYRHIPEVAWLNQALAEELRGHLENARILYAKVLAINPDNRKAAAGMRRILAKKAGGGSASASGNMQTPPPPLKKKIFVVH